MTVPADKVDKMVASAQLDATQVPNLDDLERGLGSVEDDISHLKAEIDVLKLEIEDKASASALAMVVCQLSGITARLALLEARL